MIKRIESNFRGAWKFVGEEIRPPYGHCVILQNEAGGTRTLSGLSDEWRGRFAGTDVVVAWSDGEQWMYDLEGPHGKGTFEVLSQVETEEARD